MIRLLEGVYTWGYFNPEKKYNFNGHILGPLVVDPPPLTGDDKAYMERAGLKPELCVITNRNHLRDSASWALPLALHEAELDQIGDVKAQRVLKDGDTLGPGIRVVHLPGKSPGEIALHWGTVLLVGDALIAPNGKPALIPEAKLDDPALLRRSLQKLKALEFDHLLVGDGDPILGRAKAAVQSFLG